MARSEAYKARQREQKKEEYAFYKSRGICVCCHQQDAVSGKTRCALCADIHNQYSANYIHRTNYHIEHADERHEKRKQERAERIANGICTKCGKRKARIGMKTCELCCKKEYRNQIKLRIANGYDTREMREYSNRCVICGGEHRYKHFKICKSCYDRLLQAREKAVKASIESGNNIYCNGTVANQIKGWWGECRNS